MTKEQMLLKGLRGLMSGTKVLSYLTTCFLLGALRTAVRGLTWAKQRLGDTPLPLIVVEEAEEVQHYVPETASKTDDELGHVDTCSDGSIYKQEREGDTSQDHAVPNTFAGASDLHGTLPFIVSDITAEIRAEAARGNGEAA